MTARPERSLPTSARRSTDTDIAAAPAGEKEVASWVVLARSPDGLGALTSNPRWTPLDKLPRTVPWTDDFSHILSVLRP